MDSELKTVLKMCAVVFVVILIIMFVMIGPAGIQNSFTAWKASAYGSDWLIVQYNGLGGIQNHWEIKNSAIHNEGNSDGIYFITDHGVVHLSGHYVYIQNPTAEARLIYLKVYGSNLK